MSAPTKAEAEAAYAHRDANPDAYAAAEPTDEVLANIAVIRAYEADPANQPPEDNGAQQ